MKFPYLYTFTVFTPTYNRVHTLHRVCDSLKAQTFRDFEWLIVDDGSSDGTAELVAEWEKEASFPIQYFYQENAGKHIAFNRGVREALGELFLTVDSDDAFVPEALERFLFHWNSIPHERKAQFSAVTCLCMDENGSVIGTQFPFDPTDSDSLEIRYRYKDKGDKWGFHRTEVLRKFPFPEWPVQTLIPESIVWHRIAMEYKTRFVNECLSIVFREGSDRLSRRSKIKVAPGAKLYYTEVLNGEMDWLWCDPIAFLLSSIQYVRYSFLTKDSIVTQYTRLNCFWAKLLCMISILPGYLLAIIDIFKESLNRQD